MIRSEHHVSEDLICDLPIVLEQRKRGRTVRVVDVREEDDRGRVTWHSLITWSDPKDDDNDPPPCACGRGHLRSTVERARGHCDRCILDRSMADAPRVRIVHTDGSWVESGGGLPVTSGKGRAR